MTIVSKSRIITKFCNTSVLLPTRDRIKQVANELGIPYESVQEIVNEVHRKLESE